MLATLPFATVAILSTTSGRAAAPACDANNGGLELAQGFCADQGMAFDGRGGLSVNVG